MAICPEHGKIMSQISAIESRVEMIEKTCAREHNETKLAIEKLGDNLARYADAAVQRNGSTRTDVAVLSERVAHTIQKNLVYGGSGIVILAAVSGNLHSVLPYIVKFFGG